MVTSPLAPLAHLSQSSPAASTPGSRTPSDALSGALTEHVARTLEAVQRVVAEAFAGFAEPRALDLTRARRLQVRFGETVFGFVLGQSARQLVVGIRHQFGSKVSRAVRAHLERELTMVGEGPADRLATLRTLDRANDRRVVTALEEELRTRLAQLAPRLAVLVTLAHSTLVGLEPQRADELGAVLDRLAGEPTVAERLAEELTLGWPVFVALLREENADVTTTSQLWSAWVTLVRGQRLPEALTPHDYIMVVR